MQGVTQTGEIGAAAIAAGLALWFVWRRQRRWAFALLASATGGVALNAILKLVFARPEPAVFSPLVSETGFSFPSGHMAASMAFYGFLAVRLWRTGRHALAILLAIWIILVAPSRVYLGVHYPSDTLGAMIFTSLRLIVVFGLYDRTQST